VKILVDQVYIFLVTISHNMTMCEGFVFFSIFCMSSTHLKFCQTSQYLIDCVLTLAPNMDRPYQYPAELRMSDRSSRRNLQADSLAIRGRPGSAT
jgi:hypothetical protein